MSVLQLLYDHFRYGNIVKEARFTLYFSRVHADQWLLDYTVRGIIHHSLAIMDTDTYQFVQLITMNTTVGFPSEEWYREFELAEEISSDDYKKWLTANK